MGKCVSTYILLLCFSCFFINSLAAVSKAEPCITTKEVSVINKVQVACTPLNQAHESFARHSESIMAAHISVHLIADNILFIPFSGVPRGAVISRSVTKNDQKGHLLHLFPSHYFW